MSVIDFVFAAQAIETERHLELRKIIEQISSAALDEIIKETDPVETERLARIISMGAKCSADSYANKRIACWYLGEFFWRLQ